MHRCMSAHWACAACLQQNLTPTTCKLRKVRHFIPNKQPITLWTFRQCVIAKYFHKQAQKKEKKAQIWHLNFCTIYSNWFVPEWNERRKQLHYFCTNIQPASIMTQTRKSWVLGIEMGINNVLSKSIKRNKCPMEPHEHFWIFLYRCSCFIRSPDHTVNNKQFMCDLHASPPVDTPLTTKISAHGSRHS